MSTTEWHNIVNNVTERGIAANLITRETDGTITLKESGKRTATTLTRESILQGINDWADQTLLWQDDLDDDVAATWIPSARAVKAHHWAKATLEDEEIIGYVLTTAPNFT